MGWWDTMFGGEAEREAAEQNRAALGQYQNQGYGFLDQGLGRSTGALNTGYDQATAAYQPLSALGQKYGAGSTLALDAYGANGAAGNQRAQDAFRAGPGYQFSQDQGLQALDRRRAITGMYGSGNADIDTLKFSQGLADQEYGNWRTGLQGFVNPELQATSGAATGTANAAVGRGTGLAGLYSQDADNRTNILGSVTSGNMQANNSEAAGRTSGARNLLNAGMGLASLAAGSGFGFGSLGSSLSGIAGMSNPTSTFGINPLSRGIGSN